MIIKEKPKRIIDINEIYSELLEEHDSVFVLQIDEQVFFYSPIGRSDYRYVATNEDLNDFQKEEVICDICLLWPTNYDFETCDAGIPTKLSRAIVKNSYLEDNETINYLIQSFRMEMHEKDHQITCIINEAFPQFDIEEIESWSMEKTAKYLSRAEWKIVNLRGGIYNYNPITFDLSSKEPDLDESNETEETFVPHPEARVQENNQSNYIPGETLEERQKRLDEQGFFNKKKQKLTPEKLEELKRKYPDMDWSSIDDGSSAAAAVDTRPAALRPGW